MNRPVIGRGMCGLWGAITDLGETIFTQMVAKEIPGIDIGRSPYRDYEVNQIAMDLNNAPPNAILLLWGSSLGANNCPVVATYAPHVVIHGMWGFQASLYGAQVPIPANVLFAHEVYSSIVMTGGLGAYEWGRTTDNHVTNLYLSKRYDFHPGETSPVMAMFIAEMKRVIAAAQDKVVAHVAEPAVDPIVGAAA
jgi:hypothetical protein